MPETPVVDEVAELKKKLDEARAANKKEVADLTVERDRYRKQAEDANQQLIARLDSAANKTQVAQKRSEELGSENARLKTRLDALERERKEGDAEKRLSERDNLRKQVGTQTRRVSELEKALVEKTLEIQGFRTQLSTQFARAQRESDGLKATVETMQVAREKALQERQVMADSVAELNAKIEKAQAEAAAAKRDLAALQPKKPAPAPAAAR